MSDQLITNKERAKPDIELSTKYLAEATEHVKRLADIAEHSAGILCDAIAKCDRNA